MQFICRSITRFCLIVLFTWLACGISYSEPLYDIVEVDLTRPVDIGPTVLQPGHYRFEQVNGKSDPNIFKVTGDQGEVATLTAVGFDAYKRPEPAKDTKLVLKKVGDKYYLDQIWIQGQSQGYEFPHTNVSRAELRGGQQEDVAGKRSQNSSSAQSASSQTGTQGSSSMTSTQDSANTSASPSSASTNQGSSDTTTTTNNQNSGVTASSGSTGSSSMQSSASSSTGSSGTTSNAQTYVGCIVGPVGGSYELEVSGKRYALRGDYDNVRESLGRIVTIWGVTDQSGTSTQSATSTAEPLAIAVQQITPQSEMCDATTGARLGSSGSNTTASSQSSGGTSAASGSNSSTSSTAGMDSTQSGIASQPNTASSMTDSSNKNETSSNGVTSVTGCLQSSGANDYSIKANETGKQTTVVPDAGISGELGNHVGHEVRLVGNWSDGQMSASATNNSATTSSSSSAASSMSSGSQQFRAERIDVIALSCAAQ